MFKSWFSKKVKRSSNPAVWPSGTGDKNDAPQDNTTLQWDQQATQALELSIKQAPVPAMLKGKIRKELKKGAEDIARSAGRTTVTAEDLMDGLMSRLPPHMQEKAQKMIEQKKAELEKN